MKRFLAIGFLAVCLAAALSPIIAFLSLPVPPIQPRDFTPHAEYDCDIWPARYAICFADGHFYVAGACFEGHLDLLRDCFFEGNKDGTWTVSDNGGKSCTVNGKHFKQGRDLQDYGGKP